MNFVSPVWLGVAGVVAAGVVFAHLFSSTIPPQDVLPTVRFVPESTPLTVMRSRRITDWLLLLLRVATVIVIGLALAGAHFGRRAPASVVLVDMSRAVGSRQAVVDSALRASRPGGQFVVFASSARAASADEVSAMRPSSARGSLSAALVVAHRLVGTAEGREQTQLVIVSPVAREEVDSATFALLNLWAGEVRIIEVPAGRSPAASSWEIRAAAEDPVAAALSGTPNRRAGAGVRVIRAAPTSADSQWAVAGGALVVWPTDGASLERRTVADSQGGIAAERGVVVARFARTFKPHAGKALVRWEDGEPAATERTVGSGCVRDVAIPVDAVGDVVLRESFRGIARSLLEPCGGAPDLRRADLGIARRDAAEAVQSAAPASHLGRLPLLLALIAAVALALEQLMRRRVRAVA